MGVGVASHVEPGAGPALTEVRRSEEAVNDLLVGLRAGVGEEVVDFLWRGREAGEVEAETSDENVARGFGGGLKLLFLEAGENECVDGIPDRSVNGGGRRADGLHVGPVLLDFGVITGSGIRPVGTLVNPGFEQGNLLFGEWISLEGHAVFAAEAENTLEEQAIGAVAGLEEAARIAALESCLADIQAEVAFVLLRAVALVAGGLKDGLDVTGEIDFGGLDRRICGPNATREERN
jgi:hypothetical protein